MPANPRAYFDSTRLRGVLPFVTYWVGGPPVGTPTWRHLLFMQNELVVLPGSGSSSSPSSWAAGRPLSATLASQVDEAKNSARAPDEQLEVKSYEELTTIPNGQIGVVPYSIVAKIRLVGARRWSSGPHIAFWSRGLYFARFDFDSGRGGRRASWPDREKIAYASTILPQIIPPPVRVLII